MNANKISVSLRIRRYDIDEYPGVQEKVVEFNRYLEYNNLKRELLNLCDVSPEESKVIKLRNQDEALVPFSYLLDVIPKNSFFYLDVTNISYANKTGTNFLHDAYVDAVHNKLHSMESRIAQAELLLPQLEWRRQAHMEDTVNGLATKVQFLNRRFDELLPSEWRSKMPQTMA